MKITSVKYYYDNRGLKTYELRTDKSADETDSDKWLTNMVTFGCDAMGRSTGTIWCDYFDDYWSDPTETQEMMKFEMHRRGGVGL